MDENWTSHEVPTHLQQQDKLFLGLSVLEILFMAIMLGVGYLLWKFPLFQWVPVVPRTMAVGFIVLPVMVSALIRIEDRRLPSIVYELIRHKFAQQKYTSVPFDLVAVKTEEEIALLQTQGVFGEEGSVLERMRRIDTNKLQYAIQDIDAGDIFRILGSGIQKINKGIKGPFRRRRYNRIMAVRRARSATVTMPRTDGRTDGRA